MERTARALAGYGRHGDNNLLHVSDQELRGIELLSGKKFTRNPDTGLPEAFSWSSLIPIAAGLTATALTGGAAAPLAGALASGAASAGVAAAEGKSAQQALTQGLVSGVTSYAGGSLLQGVGAGAGEAAGAAATPQTAAEIAANPAQMAASANPMASNAGYAGAESFGSATGYQGATAPTSSLINPASPSYGGAESFSPATGYQGATTSAQGSTLGQNVSQFGNRLSNIASNPGQAFEQVAKNVEANQFKALIAGGGTYAQAMDMLGPPKMPGETPYDPSKYPEQFPVNPRTWNAPGAGYQPGYSSEYRYFAKGGLADLRKEDGVTANVMNEAKAALLGEHPRPSEALGRFRNMFGEDALDVLRDKVTGGRVRGAGGGMDDLVPGTIEGRQQVRLADGEFVLPAHIVSAIGDGSTDHGVRRLKGMMDSIYKQKYKSDGLPKRLKKGTLVDE